ncbi:Ig-like domain-containing protein [Vallitalea okinawensis]|uniref:Ig-like domain-containing protein n=1 Tax=Vallitalea okinawensis TaxID=2078660 RepID=UPI000CFB4208|nr:Ig-like domain-containing protein [Vallitalea okinawensis]
MLKKLLAILMVLTIALSTMTTFAMTTIDKALVLKELGIIEGYEDGSLGLENILTREETLVLVLRLKGYTKDDLDEGSKSFDDVPVDHWAAPWIAKAKALGLTKGISPTQFGIQREVTMHEVITFLLNILEYEDTWKLAPELGLTLNLIQPDDLIDFNTPGVLRGTFVDIAYQLLQTKIHGDDITLVQKMVNEGIVDKDKAVEYGLIRPEEFGVEEINPLNLKQFEVIFNKDVDELSATDEDNYHMDEIDLDGAYYELVDSRIVQITLKDPVKQRAKTKIEVKDILSTYKEEMDLYEGEIQFIDKEFPEVIDAKVVGKDTIEITFSEPMNVDYLSMLELKAPFILKDQEGDKKGVDDVVFENHNTIVYVTWYVDFDEEHYTLDINSKYKDYAGYIFDEKKFEFDIARDTSSPQIVDYKNANPSKVTLIFDDTLKALPDEKEVYHTNVSNHAEHLSFGMNRSEIIVDFGTERIMPGGYYYIFVKEEAVEDLWGNKNDNKLKMEIEVMIDLGQLVLEDIKFESEKELILSFNKELDISTVTDESNYELFDENNDEVKSFIRYINLDEKKVTLTLRDPIVSGYYSMCVKDIEDLYGNAMEKTVLEFNADDMTAPDFDDFEAQLFVFDDEQLLVIDFKEEMLADDSIYSITNPSNYLVDMKEYNSYKNQWENMSINLDDISDVLSLDVVDDDTKLEIILESGEDYAFRDSGTIYMARVYDQSGNRTEALSGEIDYHRVTSEDTIGMDNEEGFRIISATEARLTLEELIDYFDDEDFIIEAIDESGQLKDITEYLDIDYEELSDMTEMIIEVKDEGEGYFTYDAKWQEVGSLESEGYSIYIHTIDQQYVDTENQYGQKVELDKEDHIVAEDKYAPEVLRNADDYVMLYDQLSHSIMIPFTEELQNSDYAVVDFALEMSYVDGRETTPGIDYKVTAFNETYEGYKYCVKIQLTDYDFAGDIEVIMETEPLYIKDIAGNQAIGDAYGELQDCIYQPTEGPEVVTLDATNTEKLEENEYHALIFNQKLHEDSINDIIEWITEYLTTDLKMTNLEKNEERIIKTEDIIFNVETDDTTTIKFMVSQVYKPDGQLANEDAYALNHNDSSDLWIEKDKIKNVHSIFNDKDLLLIKVQADDVDPVLVDITLGESEEELVLIFGEEIAITTAQDESNYKLFKEGNEMTSFITSIHVDDKEVMLFLNDPITSGSYSIIVEGIEDLHGNVMNMKQFDFEGDDLIPPSFEKMEAQLLVDGNQYKLVINFNESMAVDNTIYSITNLDNYRIDMQQFYASEKEWKDIVIGIDTIEDVVSITSYVDGDDHILELAVDSTSGYRFRENGTIYMQRLSDSAGNLTQSLSGEVNYSVNVKPEVITLDMTDMDTFKEDEYYTLEFNQGLNKDSINSIKEYINTYLTTEFKLLNLKADESRMIKADDIQFEIDISSYKVIRFMVDKIYDINGEITLEDAYILDREGSSNLVIEKNSIKNTNDIYNDKDLLFIKVKKEDNGEYPVIQNIKFGEELKELILTFSEDVDIKTASNNDNYELEKDGDQIATFINTIQVDQEVVVLKLNEPITSGSYSLGVAGVKDLYGYKMESEVIEFEADDTPPNFENFGAGLFVNEPEYLLVIAFQEEMLADGSEYAINNLANYRVEMMAYNHSEDKWEEKVIDLNEIEDELSVSIVDNGYMLELLVNSNDDYKFRDSGTIFMARVSDKAGNKTLDLSGKFDYERISNEDTIGMDEEKGFRVISATDARLTLSLIVDEFYGDDFIIEAVDDKGNRRDITSFLEVDYVNTPTQTEIILEVKDDNESRFTHDAKWQELDSQGNNILIDDYSIYIHTVDQQYVDTNRYGIKVELNQDDHIKADDQYAPEVAQEDDMHVMFYDESTHSIMVPFTERLENTDDVVHDFTLEMDHPAVAGIDYHVASVNQTFLDFKYCIQIQLTDLNYAGDVEVTLVDEPIYVKDVAGNEAVGGVHFLLEDCQPYQVPYQAPDVITLDVTTNTIFDIDIGYSLRFSPTLEEDSSLYVQEAIAEYLKSDFAIVSVETGELRKIDSIECHVSDYSSGTTILFRINKVVNEEGESVNERVFTLDHLNSLNMWIEKNKIKNKGNIYNDKELLLIKVNGKDER